MNHRIPRVASSLHTSHSKKQATDPYRHWYIVWFALAAAGWVGAVWIARWAFGPL
jgi:hypothetical protein